MATVNYSWTLPTVGASVNTWGTLLNTIIDDIDTKMVSKTATQTLTNKTLTAPTFTGGITVSSGGASITGNTSVTGTLGVSAETSVAGALVSTSANLAHQANAVKLSYEGSSLSQLSAYGANTTTQGSISVVAKSSNGSLSTVVGTFSSTGLAVDGSVSATGITFPATQNASSDANTLDDYEEGTWTPAVNLLGTLTYGTQYGKYVKIGRQVTVNFNISVSSTDTTQDSSAFLISGFPFTAADVATAKVLTERAYYMSGDSTKSRTFNVYLGASSSTASVQVEQWNGVIPNASYYFGAVRTIYQAGSLFFSGTIVYFV